ncbi:hypothetical protein J6Y73_01315 [bacterium]|nr:hypothetical protein [bacterium]
MIKQLVKVLNQVEGVDDYRIIERTEKSHQAFFVLSKLETTRLVETCEYQVTVYNRHNNLIGSSDFNLSHKVSNKELEKLIKDAVYAATFVSNKDFNLVNGQKKKSFKDAPFNDSFETITKKVYDIYTKYATPNLKFNAVELFYNELTTHVVNSKGVNLTKTNYNLEIESIPSYDGDNKVEIYKFDSYPVLDYDQIESNVKQALEDVKARYKAVKLPKIKKCDVILKDNDCGEFFESFIDDYSYRMVFSGATDKKPGDMLVDANAKTKLSITLAPSSKAKAFDNDGLLLKKFNVVDKGALTSYYGDNVMGQYLGIDPSGVPDEIQVKKGSKSLDSLKKGKYIEIIALSGIQIDVRGDYIGGEVRLGIYHNGEEEIPVSGFSFSGSFKNALNTLTTSKEIVKIKGYNGPKYLKIKNVSVM